LGVRFKTLPPPDLIYVANPNAITMNNEQHRFTFQSALVLVLLLAAPPSASGQHSVHLLERDGRRLELQISEQFEKNMQRDLLAWIESLSASLSQVYGHWPRHRWQISVAPAPSSGSDPIPWAEVKRGDIDRVEFLTAANASTRELEQAWTGYHELAHLLIPYRGWGDAWFTEGLASYYQSILQARAGLLSEQAMWQKLYDGFQRGLAETQFDGQSLQSVSDNLRSNGGFMRVYWSGAWYFLAADTRLRLQSGGRHNLDEALEKLNQCCADQRLSVPQIISQLDQLNRVVLFQRLYEEVAESTRVPPFESIFASMGIAIIDGRVQLQQAGPGARLRQQIFSSGAL
jgi:M61 glycyl aminopeptidase